LILILILILIVDRLFVREGAAVSVADVNIEVAFEVRVRDQGTTRVVTPAGEVDLATVGAVREPVVAGLCHGFETVVVDLGETTFLDSTGIKLLFEVANLAELKRVALVLLPGPPAVQRAIDLCGLSAAVRFTRTEAFDTPAA
jgi:anti-anti-sigma factor